MQPDAAFNVLTALIVVLAVVCSVAQHRGKDDLWGDRDAPVVREVAKTVIGFYLLVSGFWFVAMLLAAVFSGSAATAVAFPPNGLTMLACALVVTLRAGWVSAFRDTSKSPQPAHYDSTAWAEEQTAARARAAAAARAQLEEAQAAARAERERAEAAAKELRRQEQEKRAAARRAEQERKRAEAQRRPPPPTPAERQRAEHLAEAARKKAAALAERRRREALLRAQEEKKKRRAIVEEPLKQLFGLDYSDELTIGDVRKRRRELIREVRNEYRADHINREQLDQVQMTLNTAELFLRDHLPAAPAMAEDDGSA